MNPLRPLCIEEAAAAHSGAAAADAAAAVAAAAALAQKSQRDILTLMERKGRAPDKFRTPVTDCTAIQAQKPCLTIACTNASNLK